MNEANLEIICQSNNSDSHYVKRLTYLMNQGRKRVLRDNGNPAGIVAIADSLSRGIQPDSCKNAQDILNKKCLPVQTERNKRIENIFKNALLKGVNNA